MPKPVQESFDVLTTAKEKINAILKVDPNSVMTLLAINTLFERIEARLRLFGSVADPVAEQAKGNPLQPMKTFMGKIITRTKPLDRSLTTPKQEHVARIANLVDQLEVGILKLNPHSILKAYTSPDSLLVLRGLAKRAGMADFKERAIDVKFIADIKNALNIRLKVQEKIELQDTGDVENELQEDRLQQIVKEENTWPANREEVSQEAKHRSAVTMGLKDVGEVKTVKEEEIPPLMTEEKQPAANTTTTKNNPQQKSR